MLFADCGENNACKLSSFAVIFVAGGFTITKYNIQDHFSLDLPLN